MGEIVAIDADGTRKPLNDDDNVRWLFFSVLGRFPESPRIPTDPQAEERARQTRASMEARKPRNFTVTKDEAGNVVLTLDDGTTAKLPVTP